MVGGKPTCVTCGGRMAVGSGVFLMVGVALGNGVSLGSGVRLGGTLVAVGGSMGRGLAVWVGSGLALGRMTAAGAVSCIFVGSAIISAVTVAVGSATDCLAVAAGELIGAAEGSLPGPSVTVAFSLV